MDTESLVTRCKTQHDSVPEATATSTVADFNCETDCKDGKCSLNRKCTCNCHNYPQS